jgi:hypothetical protein
MTSPAATVTEPDMLSAYMKPPEPDLTHSSATQSASTVPLPSLRILAVHEAHVLPSQLAVTWLRFKSHIEAAGVSVGVGVGVSVGV